MSTSRPAQKSNLRSPIPQDVRVAEKQCLSSGKAWIEVDFWGIGFLDLLL
jgi:hypothetical protein